MLAEWEEQVKPHIILTWECSPRRLPPLLLLSFNFLLLSSFIKQPKLAAFVVLHYFRGSSTSEMRYKQSV